LFVFLPDTYVSGELTETLDIFADFLAVDFKACILNVGTVFALILV
jgi:hypothetical protein